MRRRQSRGRWSTSPPQNRSANSHKEEGSLKTTIVLAMHGAPPKDFPRRELGEFFGLSHQLGHSGGQDHAALQDRHRELETMMRAWPRTEANDPYHAAAFRLAEQLRLATADEVVVGFNEFCGPTLGSSPRRGSPGAPRPHRRGHAHDDPGRGAIPRLISRDRSKRLKSGIRASISASSGLLRCRKSPHSWQRRYRSISGESKKGSEAANGLASLPWDLQVGLDVLLAVVCQEQSAVVKHCLQVNRPPPQIKDGLHRPLGVLDV